jgi:hypothetical protein
MRIVENAGETVVSALVRHRRFHRALLASALALFAFAALVAGAAAAPAPAWKLLAVTGPTNLPPKQSEIQRVTVEAEHGSFKLAQTTAEGEGTLGFVLRAGNLVEGSDEVTLLSFGQGSFVPGMEVSGGGLPAGTTVIAVNGEVVTLSSPAPSTGLAFLSAASKEVNGVSTAVGEFRAGDTISGSGIPAGTTIISVSGGTLDISQPPTAGGKVALTGTEITAPILYDASAAAVQSALESLPALAGAVSVSGGPGGDAEHPWFVDFGGPYALRDVDQLVADGASLTGEHANAYVSTIVGGGNGTGKIAVYPSNIGGAPTSGTVTVTVGPLPPGIVTSGQAGGTGWNCPGSSGESIVTCTSTQTVGPITLATPVLAPVEVESPSASTSSAAVEVSGGAVSNPSDIVQMPIVISSNPATPGVQAFWGGAFDDEGNPSTQAGGHPASAPTEFAINTVRSRTGQVIPAAESKDVVVDLPSGFLGNPLVTSRCPQNYLVPFEQNDQICGDEEVLGNFGPVLSEFGNAALGPTFFYNDVPATATAAEFSTKVAFPVQSLLGSVRSSEDFGVRITAPNNPPYLRIFGSFAALEGIPAAAHGKAFLTNPTNCAEEAAEPPVVTAKFDSFQDPGNYSNTAVQVLPPVTGCDKLEFTPTFSFQPTTTTGSAPTGAVSRLAIPQEGLTDPNKLAQPYLKDVTVTLPQGLGINPSSADGLESCSEAQIGYLGNNFPMPNPTRFNEADPTCPDGSKLGTAEIKTPLLENPLMGTIYLAAQEENPFGSLLAIYLVVDDASTGQMTATFSNNPQLPFEELTLNFRGGGPRSELTTPEVCGHYTTTGSLTPWSAPESGPPAQIQEAGFDISSDCASSASTRPFSPGFEAGTTGTQAGGYSPLVIKLSRKDGEQELTSLDFTLPKGLIGKLAGIPYCSDGAINAAQHASGKDELANPSCPAASQIGTVDTAAGLGSEPFHVGGKVYLAGPYKGAPISSVVVTPAVAGPLDLGDVVVQAPLYVNPESAVLTAKSDPIPTILRGIPLKVRSVTINVDKPGFILNPTNCTPMTASASIGSSNGATATPSNRFQVGGCETLKFAPKLQVKLNGGTRRNANPALVATLSQAEGQANIAFASVALPHSEFLEQGHIRTVCTRVQFAAEQCPTAAIYGRAEAITPLLDQPLSGPVYLRSSSHRLPDLVAVLKGPPTQPIEIDLDGRIDSLKGGIRTTFETVPDAPVSKFVLRMQGGKKSLLVNSTNICRGTHKATVKMTGQNAVKHNFLSPLKAKCPKKPKKTKAPKKHGKK